MTELQRKPMKASNRRAKVVFLFISSSRVFDAYIKAASEAKINDVVWVMNDHALPPLEILDGSLVINFCHSDNSDFVDYFWKLPLVSKSFIGILLLSLFVLLNYMHSYSKLSWYLGWSESVIKTLKLIQSSTLKTAEYSDKGLSTLLILFTNSL